MLTFNVGNKIMKKPIVVARLGVSELSYNGSYICLNPNQIDSKMITLDVTFNTIGCISNESSFFHNSFSELLTLRQGLEYLLLSSTANERDIVNNGLKSFDRMSFKMKTNKPSISEANRFCRTTNNLVKHLDSNSIYSFYDSLDTILKKNKIKYIWFEFLAEANKKGQFYFYDANNLKSLLNEALELITNNEKLISNNRFYR